MKPGTWFSLSLVVPGALLLWLWPLPASANVGPPSWGGQIIAEPTGIKDVDITRETLVIDARPLAHGEPVGVEAIYHLYNRGGEKQLDLVFASGSEKIGDFEVWLGEEAVSSKPAEQKDLPASWQPPKTTPGIHDDAGIGYLNYGRSKAYPRAITVKLPPGEQSLKVRYRAEAARYHGSNQPTNYWQFAYILAPAREWGKFGGLDVTIHLPDNWYGACTPALPRDGDLLHGDFTDLPADAIAFTLQAPVSSTYQPIVLLGQGMFWLMIVGGFIMCGWCGWSKGRQNQRAWLAAIGLAILWGVAVLLTGLFAIHGSELAIPAGQKNNYGYGEVFAFLGVVVLSLLVVPVGFSITLISAIIARRRLAAGAFARTREAVA